MNKLLNTLPTIIWIKNKFSRTMYLITEIVVCDKYTKIKSGNQLWILESESFLETHEYSENRKDWKSFYEQRKINQRYI